MFAPFPEEAAYEKCKELLDLIEQKKIILKQVSQISEERFDHGVMVGVLICTDINGNKVQLNTVSGISKELCLADGFDFKDFIFVNPIVVSEQTEDALSKNNLKIHELTDILNNKKTLRKKSDGTYNYPDKEECDLIEERNALCNESLEKFYALYSFHCADGKVRTLNEICKENCNGKLPPTGTGDCCAPKLLDYAFAHNLQPVSMCEVFCGKSSGNKISGEKYAPCDERCGLILPTMLGLNILYRDEDIIVVNKQSGVLSVPGRGPEKQDCIVNRVKRLFPNSIEQPSVHRLDMETSGILVLAFTKEAHKNLNHQFENGEIQKQYVALLDGVLPRLNIPNEGQNELYFRLDVENRPHQIWDSVYGKKSITEWKVLDVETYTSPDGSTRNVTRVLFTPHTGRTHQLRLASSDSHGFGVPIVGDTLYGHCEKGERLMLHAQYLCFTHPSTGKKMEFFCKSEF